MRDPTEILATIPEWEGAQWVRLCGGTNRQVFRVANGDAIGVLKVGKDDRGAPFNTYREEAIVQSNAARTGMAPRVLHVAADAYLSEYVVGECWTQTHFEKSDNLRLLATTLKRVHTLPLSGRIFDASEAARRYLEKIVKADAHIVTLCNEVIESTRLPQSLSCCHNDLVAENLLATPDLMLIDWEYACDNDPFFDLAAVIEHHDLRDEQIVVLMESYLGGNDIVWHQHLSAQRRLYLALLWLWLSQRVESGSCEIERVAARLLTSCS